MAIIKKLKDFIETRSFLSKNKKFTQYERSKRTFYAFIKNGWKMKDNYIYKYNKYTDCNLKIKDTTKDILLCVEDIPWKDTWSMENVREAIYDVGSHYDFDNPFKSIICKLLNKHWEEYLGDMSQADDESDEDVYNREKISKELFDIFVDYEFYSFDNGFTFLKFGESKYSEKRTQISGKQMSIDYDFSPNDMIIGIQIGFLDEITKDDVGVLESRLLSIDENLKFNSELYSREGYDRISKFAFYYEFKNIKELSDYLIKLGLIK